MTLKHAITVGVVVVSLLSLFTWAILRPQPLRPNVTVKLSGYTNDSGGARLAVFVISNSSSDAVLRRSHYRIQTPVSNRWADVSEDWLASGGSVLPAGGVELVSIPVATNVSWRVSFLFSADVGVLRTVLGSIAEASRSAGFRPRYRPTSYGIASERIGK
jgi:hypothetical protein